MQDLKTEVKSRVDIIDVIGKYVPVKKAGTNYKANCPFHSEKTPSFMINPGLQIYKCFGCGKAGDAISFVMEMEGLEFLDALNLLAEQLGIDTSKYKNVPKTSNNKVLYDLNDATLKFYQYTLTNLDVGKTALEYLKDRGLNSKHIEEFKLGYAPNSWNSLFNYLKSKKFKESDIVKAGLVKQGGREGYYDAYRGRIMFPLENQGGKVVGFAGRTILNEDPKYINTKDTPIFNKSAFIYNLNRAKTEIRRKKEVIVTEGEFDAIKPYIKGIKNIVALKGTAFTADQAKLLKRYADVAYIFFDTDSAGDEATLRGIEIASSQGLDIKVASLPSKYKDPDEAASHSIDLIYKAIEDAVPTYDYYFSYATKQYDYKDALGKKNISNFLMPKINKISNTVLKDHYTKKLSELLDVSEQALVSRSESSKEKIVKGEKELETKSKEFDPIFMYLLRSNSTIFNEFYKEIKKEELLNGESLVLLNNYYKEVVKEKKDKGEFVAQNGLEELFLRDLGEFDESEDYQRRTLLGLVNTSKSKKVREDLKGIGAQMDEAEKLGDKEKLDKLQKKFKILTEKLKNYSKPL